MDVGLKLKNRKVWFNCMDYSFHSYIFFYSNGLCSGSVVVHRRPCYMHRAYWFECLILHLLSD